MNHIFLIALTIFALVSTNVQAAETLKWNYKNTDIVDVIESYSKASGQKFIVEPSVRGKISIFNQAPIELNEAFDQLSEALAINGFALVKKDNSYVVMSSRSSTRSYLQTTTEVPSLKPERMVTWIYTPKYISAEMINREMRMFSSKDGEINIVSKTNQIIVSDWSSSINRFYEVLKQVDQPVSSETKKLVDGFFKEREEMVKKRIQSATTK